MTNNQSLAQLVGRAELLNVGLYRFDIITVQESINLIKHDNWRSFNLYKSENEREGSDSFFSSWKLFKIGSKSLLRRAEIKQNLRVERCVLIILQ